MKSPFVFLVAIVFTSLSVFGQSEKTAIKMNLNDEGSHFIQATLLNQSWLRFTQANPGTTVEGVSRESIFDIGLRRTRMQMFGQLTDHVFMYFQFGQNNFNAQVNSSGNRKLNAFFHDALCEYKVTQDNSLKIGAGLSIASGLSRFSQPSIGTIMTLDVPVFAQTTVDQIDEFGRKLSLYARGQIGKLDYRLALSDPFPISSTGSTPPPLASAANFAQRGHYMQQQGYFIYQFFDHEPHTTPYMTGTYLGKKKIFNIAIGGIFQKDALWRTTTGTDTVYQNMAHLAVESYLDMPLNKEKKTAISAYLGFFNTNYGTNYLRYNGLMNMANGTTLNSNNSITGRGPTFGNAHPMFGTGKVIYAQMGYLLPAGEHAGRWMPYAAATLARYDYLGDLWSNNFNAGINYFIKDHTSKISVEWQNRPTFEVSNNVVQAGDRRNCLITQYQIYF